MSHGDEINPYIDKNIEAKNNKYEVEESRKAKIILEAKVRVVL